LNPKYLTLPTSFTKSHKQTQTASHYQQSHLRSILDLTSTAKTTGILLNDTIDVNDVVDPQNTLKIPKAVRANDQNIIVCLLCH